MIEELVDRLKHVPSLEKHSFVLLGIPVNGPKELHDRGLDLRSDVDFRQAHVPNRKSIAESRRAVPEFLTFIDGDEL